MESVTGELRSLRVFCCFILVVAAVVWLLACVPTQYSSERRVSIFPGNELFVEADIEGNSLVNLRVIDTVENPEKTLSFQLSQSSSGSMLSVKNPFNVSIKYHVNMVDLDGNHHKTSSCPLTPKGGAFEMWPHPIPQLEIFNFRVIDISGGGRCEY
jgi:hypothetical protein